MAETKTNSRNPWFWIPTLYLAEGLPYALAMSVSVVLYKNLGVANHDIAFYTSLLYLPWVIKPLWSPLVDILKTRRLWIWTMQLFVGAALAGVALAIPLPHFFQITLALFWLAAFASATHDIAADGFYLLALPEREQALFSGVRNTFYRVATICAVGGLVILAGIVQSHTSLPSSLMKVQSDPNAAVVNTIDVGLVNAMTTNTEPLRVVTESTTIRIKPEARPKVEISSLLETARSWNVKNGFCAAEEKLKTAKGSWWTRYISQPLGVILDRYFQPNQKANNAFLGNIGLMRLSLSSAPDHEIVVIPALKEGKDVSIVEGSRVVFNATNWNRPAVVIFQLDPKLRGEFSDACALRSGNIPLSWSTAFALIGGILVCFGFYHWFVLPRPVMDQSKQAASPKFFLAEFFKTFGKFFQKPKIITLLLFLLLYRFGEAQLVKMVQLFLLDARDKGGLGLTNNQLSLTYGTVGVIALMLGGLLGGYVISKRGLKFWLWPMLLAIHLPDAVFIWLAYARPENFFAIGAGVAVEQFGYGFGFTAFMLYMIYIARGEHPTAHYAICTGFMALGMMLPGMWSGWLQEHIGYQHFFVWVILATIPSFWVATKIPLESDFGKRS